MARTVVSIEREREHQAAIQREQFIRNIARVTTSGSVLFSAAALADSFSNAAITKVLNIDLSKTIEVHLSTHNLLATRLPVAGLYAATAVVSAIQANRHQARVDTLNLLAAQEAQSDRQATALELSTGQLSVESAIFDPYEQPPIFSRSNAEQG